MAGVSGCGRATLRGSKAVEITVCQTKNQWVSRFIEQAGFLNRPQFRCDCGLERFNISEEIGPGSLPAILAAGGHGQSAYEKPTSRFAPAHQRSVGRSLRDQTNSPDFSVKVPDAIQARPPIPPIGPPWL
jgi:hypothetical protein